MRERERESLGSGWRELMRFGEIGRERERERERERDPHKGEKQREKKGVWGVSEKVSNMEAAIQREIERREERGERQSKS